MKCVVLLIVVVAGCVTMPTSIETGQETTLRVALFPYLPNADDARHNETLRARIESEFESRHPSIDLELRKFDTWEDFYDPKWLASLLVGDNPYDVVEIDTVLLGALLDLEVITDWDDAVTLDDFQSVAKDAGQLHGKTYGIPHWMCGHFIMTEYSSVAQAQTARDLVSALQAAAPVTRNLAGDFRGSWNLPALYLDAWADTRSDPNLASALRVPVDSDVVQQLKWVASQGYFDGANPCLDDTYHDDVLLAPRHFADGKADALLGYSERLHYVVSYGANADDLFVSSAPLGQGSDPVWFIDVFVRPHYSDDLDDAITHAKRDAAAKFVEYMNDPDTFAWIHAAEDIGAESAPRYLIPATKSAFKAPELAQDPIMQQIEPLLDRGTFLPRHNMPGIRRLMGAEILQSLSAR